MARLCNQFAWGLATQPDPSLRDGTLAVEYARRAVQLTEGKNGGYLDTLAAACAEQGDFEQAIRWQNEALALASAEERPELESRLRLYERGQAFHQPPETTSSHGDGKLEEDAAP